MADLGRVSVAIVGGGFTGAAVALHLAGRLPPQAKIAVIEPREMLGGGLAYSSREPAHRTNVPAARMSLFLDDPEHFARWLALSGELERDPAAIWAATGAAFPQRRIFGDYIALHLAPAIDAGRVVHLADRASAADRVADGSWSIALASGERIVADILVLACTHPLPATPAPFSAIAHEPGYLADPYDPAGLAAVSATARVLIAGSGLTASDVVATLDRRGHSGPILAVSRNGLRSRGHATTRGEWPTDFAAAGEGRARLLLRAIRRDIDKASAQGIPWHWIMDRVRDQGSEIWASLPPPERTILVRRLRSFWDVHRFRIAPQVEAVIDRRAADGSFTNIAARLVASRPTPSGLEVTFRPRGEREMRTGVFDLVVNTTGPSHRGVLAGEGILPGLGRAGYLRCDTVGLGLATTQDGRAIGADDTALDNLLIAGPLARGTFGELMGIPEVSSYALFIAERVVATAQARSVSA